jgi:hypothetical protein
MPPPIERIHWVQVRAQVTCMQCNQKSPLEALDVDGRFFCVTCQRDGLFDVDLWKETVLPFASGIGDCFWARAGLFPPWPTPPTDKSFWESQGDPWSDHASALPGSLQSVFPSVGVDRCRIRIEQSGMTMGSAGMRTRGLTVELAPGHPLCTRCRAPLAPGGPGRGVASLRCNACGTEETYRAPDAALGWAEDLFAVVAPDHVQGKSAVRIEAQAGNAAVAIKCPSCGSPVQLAPDERFVTCAYCKASSLVPTGVLAQAFRKPAAPRPWWLAMRSPSSLRTALLGATQRAPGGILVVPPGSSVGEYFQPSGSDGDDDGPNVGMWIGIVLGGIAGLAGIGVAIWVNVRSPDDSPPAAAPPHVEKAAPTTPPAVATPLSGCTCTSGDGTKQPKVVATLSSQPKGRWGLDVTTHPAGRPFEETGNSDTLSTREGTVPPPGTGQPLHMGLACDAGVVVFASGKTATGWSTADMHLEWTTVLPAAVAEPSMGVQIGCFPLAQQGDAVTVPLTGGKRVVVALGTGKVR